MDFISDLGGQLGLWLGLSMMTIVEVLEFLTDALRLLCSKCTKSGTLNNESTEQSQENTKDLRQS